MTILRRFWIQLADGHPNPSPRGFGVTAYDEADALATLRFLVYENDPEAMPKAREVLPDVNVADLDQGHASQMAAELARHLVSQGLRPGSPLTPKCRNVQPTTGRIGAVSRPEGAPLRGKVIIEWVHVNPSDPSAPPEFSWSIRARPLMDDERLSALLREICRGLEESTEVPLLGEPIRHPVPAK